MRALWALILLALSASVQAAPRCLSECTPRIGIVSAFGAEADLLIAETTRKRTWTLAGKRYTTGTLRGQRVVIVLSGVSMVNSAMVTQQMLDHFRIERLIMSGIAGGLNPAQHVGDVTVPERWAMPMEVYWNADTQVPAPCGRVADVGCLGLKLATGADGQPLPPYAPGLFMRETHVLSAAHAPQGEFRFDYPVDADMLAVARTIAPRLERCGPKARLPSGELDAKQCVREQPQLRVGGLGVSAPIFLANAAYRQYLFDTLKAETFEMETAALAHVARANGVPYIAFRSISDLAGATEFNADVGALFMSGLAEANEAAVTLAFLDAWKARKATKR